MTAGFFTHKPAFDSLRFYVGESSFINLKWAVFQPSNTEANVFFHTVESLKKTCLPVLQLIDEYTSFVYFLQ